MTDPRASDPSNRHEPAAGGRALGALQFPDLLAHVAGFAATPLGAERVRSLIPRAVVRGDTAARDEILAEHARVAAMRLLLSMDEGWPSQAIPDLWAAIEKLEVMGSIWTGTQLRELIVLLTGARAQSLALRKAAAGEKDSAATRRASATTRDLSALDELRDALINDASLATAIDKIVDDEGTVRDSASPELRKIRRQLRGAESELVKLLEKLMSKLESHHRVDDASVTMRNGRWVIPVRREGRGSLGGIVHDSSATGATVFVEPPAAVEFGNRIRELENEEAREVDRVLLEATDTIRDRAEAIAATLDAMIELDSLAARGRFADRYRCAPAALRSPSEGISICDGRHPLLLAQQSQTGSGSGPGTGTGDGRVVPFDLVLDSTERTLLVSGPNTGGKTVLLKAVALVSLMAQAGIPATVGAGSALPLYDHVFADIGDEQSIEASLSTFSGHVKNLVEIVENATPLSLVLVDELGSGTDPNEGAALGGAILESLTLRGTTSVATTHLGALKELAHEVRGVVNASLQFDEAALAPTYRLLKGIPGRSYGLSIARRLRMPAAIMERADARVPDAERSAAALLEDLERRQRELDAREKEIGERDESYAARSGRIVEREQKVKNRERELEREAREASRKYVLEARREIEAAIAAVKRAGASSDDSEVAALAFDARRIAETRLAAEREELQKLESDQADQSDQPDPIQAVAVGDFVAVSSLGGATAQVIEARGKEFVVAVGAMKTTVPSTAVRRISKKRAGVGGAAVEPVSIGGAAPDVHAKHEIDLRGMRIGELDTVVQVALDDAVRADLPSIRIIHGKGTGALRERVGELLRDDPRVRSFRLGAWNEGGAGVTVAELA
jgi:DNA mismatch repair protein MutS2